MSGEAVVAVGNWPAGAVPDTLKRELE